jgi:hypothetical protein
MHEDNYTFTLNNEEYLVFSDEHEISISARNYFSVEIPQKKTFVLDECRKRFTFRPEEANAFFKWARLHEDVLPRPLRDNLRGVLSYVIRRYERKIGKIFK